MIVKPDSLLVEGLHPSPNIGVRRDGCRPRLLLMHYTGMESAAKAIDWLARPESSVSCHYVIDETGLITQMVPETARAWHAGASHWAGETDINSVSIGIEMSPSCIANAAESNWLTIRPAANQPRSPPAGAEPASSV